MTSPSTSSAASGALRRSKMVRTKRKNLALREDAERSEAALRKGEEASEAAARRRAEQTAGADADERAADAALAPTS